jgi:F-type H+-transporting ATPase subunit delta
MKISKQSKREARQLFRSCVVNGYADENRVRQTVSAVIEKKPRGYIGILSQFQRLVKLDLAKRTAKVESAGPISDALKNEVQSNLSRVYGSGLDISFAENPSLIGGLRIQIGSDVYDGSIQTKLKRLAETF